jgi:hypothetical protein
MNSTAGTKNSRRLPGMLLRVGSRRAGKAYGQGSVTMMSPAAYGAISYWLKRN